MISEEHKSDIKTYYYLYHISITTIFIMVIHTIIYIVSSFYMIFEYVDVYEDLVMTKSVYEACGSIYTGAIIFILALKCWIIPKSEMWKKLVIATGSPEEFSKKETLKNIKMLGDKLYVPLSKGKANVFILIYVLFMSIIIMSSISIDMMSAIDLQEEYDNSSSSSYDYEYVKDTYYETVLSEFENSISKDMLSKETINNDYSEVSNIYDMGDFYIFCTISKEEEDIVELAYLYEIDSKLSKEDNLSRFIRITTPIHENMLEDCENHFNSDFIKYMLEVPNRVSPLFEIGSELSKSRVTILGMTYEQFSSEKSSVTFGIDKPLFAVIYTE